VAQWQCPQWLCIQGKLNQHKPASNRDQTGSKSPSCTPQILMCAKAGIKFASSIQLASGKHASYCNFTKGIQW
jgi:hypothetical protein